MGVGVQLKQWSSQWSSEQFKVKLSPDFAVVVSSFLRPAALSAAVFGLWRLTSDMNWTKQFPISNGLFSHWQVWLVVGALLQVAASTLGRGRRARSR
jgi:hypothetical protein